MSGQKIYPDSSLRIRGKTYSTFDIDVYLDGEKVSRCARRMRLETKSQRLYELAGLIIKAGDEKVTSMASGLLNEMAKDGLLELSK